MYTVIVIAFFSIFLVSCSKDLKGDQSKLPTLVADTSVTIIGTTTPNAVIKANVTSTGASQLTERGVCYDTLPSPTVSKMVVKSDSATMGAFSLKLNGLGPNTKYYVRAYATNSSGTSYSNEITFSIPPVKIGDEFKGGIVFYLDATGRHGLIAAKAGNDISGVWGCAVDVPGTKTEIGSGKANTKAILDACGNTVNVAKLCDDSKWYGFTDWYLPSRDELAEMFKYRDLIGFNNAPRWSSSQTDANTAWSHTFDASGTTTSVNKATVQGARPIRSF